MVFFKMIFNIHKLGDRNSSMRVTQCVSQSLNLSRFSVSFQRLSKEQTQLLASLSNVKEKLQASCERNASLLDEISGKWLI